MNNSHRDHTGYVVAGIAFIFLLLAAAAFYAAALHPRPHTAPIPTTDYGTDANPGDGPDIDIHHHTHTRKPAAPKPRPRTARRKARR